MASVDDDCEQPSSVFQSAESIQPLAQPSAADQWVISAFDVFERVGRGRFGYVHKVKRKGQLGDGKLYAMKVLFKHELAESGVLQQLLKEVEIQSRVKHPRIVRLLGVSQDARRVYLFSALIAHGSIYTHLKRVGRFPEEVTGKYMKQLLNAVTYLHSKNICHRDIKPENLLLAASGDLMLCDFGWCSPIDEENKRTTICGTPEYLPPEMITRTCYSKVVDSWTCGVLCYEFLVGRPPFLAPSQHEIYSKIVVADYMVPPHVSEGAAHFLSCALRVNAEKRYTAGELFLHGWVQLQDEDAMGILEWEKKRDTDEEANRTERLKNRCPRLSWDQKLAAEREEKVVPGEKENYAKENSR